MFTYRVIKDRLDQLKTELRSTIEVHIKQEGHGALLDDEAVKDDLEEFIYNAFADKDWYGGQLEEDQIRNWDMVPKYIDQDEFEEMVREFRAASKEDPQMFLEGWTEE